MAATVVVDADVIVPPDARGNAPKMSGRPRGRNRSGRRSRGWPPQARCPPLASWRLPCVGILEAVEVWEGGRHSPPHRRPQYHHCHHARMAALGANADEVMLAQLGHRQLAGGRASSSQTLKGGDNRRCRRTSRRRSRVGLQKIQ